jgi:hypothetical protein
MGKIDRAKQRKEARQRKNAPPMPPPPRFDEWMKCIFYRPASLRLGAVVAWDDAYYALEAEHEFDGTDREVGELFIYTMQAAGASLANCDNDQIACGLRMLFDSGASDLCFQLRGAFPDRIDKPKAIRSLFQLYFDIFAKRCSLSLCHLNEPGDDLQGVCYMLWDVTPLTGWCGIADPSTNQSILVETLERVLYVPHDACIESALHGLGHLQGNDGIPPSQIGDAIRRFLAATPSLRPELRNYAEQAISGRIL